MPDVIRIFISYARKDSRDLAIRLRDDLQKQGYSVWLDLSQIPGGADWLQTIEDAIEQCDIELALMSSGSNASPWCKNEQLRALRKGKRLIPILAAPHTDPPLHLEHLNFLDFTDEARYAPMLRDLITDINAAQAFQQPRNDQPPSPIANGAGGGSSPAPPQQKRSAAAFRASIRELRAESWLGSRHWWPFFLFYYTDLHSVVDVLRSGELLAPRIAGGSITSRWDDSVRLYFRPRTPDLFHAEGFRPARQPVPPRYAPIPVYLLFDLESVLTLPDVRFTDTDPIKAGDKARTYQTPSSFQQMPFEQIYHDSALAPDEKDEILRCREAQVIVPERLTLESLQSIWLRSAAEYETLHQLLPAATWAHWHDKITTRTDYHLFNNRRPYVTRAVLQPQQVTFFFNPCQHADDCGPYLAQIIIEHSNGQRTEWQDDALGAQEALHFAFAGDAAGQDAHAGAYSVQLLLDGELAYAGHYQPQMIVL